ncbi:MAG: type I restriction enzyme HsdR N-terminal domain-containing protein [Desulfobacterales bacterium]|jgi:hypothetical protein|nr:type I restriction enzyme HsdR N-terminal domain-containing protein [Desulfobacterales bacterium]
MGGHHLTLGRLSDFLTGETLDDTLDERDRQQLATFLVEQKGYQKSDILPRQRILVSAGACRAHIPLDFTIHLSSIIGMIIKYGPGSIVTRRRSTLSLSRICAPYQVPIVVVTNGKSAEILDGESGNILSEGLETIPSRRQLEKTLSAATMTKIDEKRFEMESRILYAFEVDGACPCDDTICRLQGDP